MNSNQKIYYFSEFFNLFSVNFSDVNIRIINIFFYDYYYFLFNSNHLINAFYSTYEV